MSKVEGGAVDINNLRFRDKVLSRKFLFSLFICLITTLLQITDHIPAEIFAQIVNVTILGYLTGNVAETFVTKNKNV